MPFKFEKLYVWQRALDLSEQVHLLTKTFPREEIYVLTSQMKRAADSVSLNIAEGSTGQSDAEQKKFLGYALRSDIEVVGCLHIALRRGYISGKEMTLVYRLCEEILSMIVAFRSKLK